MSKGRASESGAALVELAVALPVLVAVLVGTADFARVFYTSIQLTNAARAGAQYGATGKTAAEIQTAAAASVSITGITFPTPPTVTCECATTGAVFTTIACSTPAASACTSGSFRVLTVSVTVQKTFTTIAPYPGIPHTLTLTRSARIALNQ